MTNTLNRISEVGIVPVVVMDSVDHATPTARALMEGGVPVMEITLRTDAGLDSIKKVAGECPGMMVGAGTVTSLDDCKKSVEHGAQFIVSPGFDEGIVRWCIEHGVAVIPGVITPTEIMQAIQCGINVVKFFPAGVFGGLAAMKTLSGPFGGVKFIPTGGIDESNLGEYISAPFIFAAGGSWMCRKKDIANSSFAAITQACRRATDIVQSIKGVMI